jgi:hypothetical protein
MKLHHDDPPGSPGLFPWWVWFAFIFFVAFMVAYGLLALRYVKVI